MTTTYTVRRPGCTAWSTHRTLRAALREWRRAEDRVSGHEIYVEAGVGEDHDIGTVYRDGDDLMIQWGNGSRTTAIGWEDRRPCATSITSR
jgi:hypothetical protein